MLFLHYEIHDSNYIAPLFGFNENKTCFFLKGVHNTTKISTTQANLKQYRHELKTRPEIWVSI